MEFSERILRDILAREIQWRTHDDFAAAGEDADLAYSGDIHSVLRGFVAEQHCADGCGQTA